LPVAAWEFSLGVYLIARGLRVPAAVADDAIIVTTSPALVNAVTR
jgi:hypothetical protein